ncbi:M20/M25/M40 family metallo-hydrolase [Lacticaseibacillus nasuensis]|uniref:M20/M25/M40 family metallo-hydrolase n=1 Tax=Lacticaseibacillus nasuensis TaxID=944671 RepID=UPI000AF63870|nr:M20/M25/M40 family metallo-hydrolase [Lacticaseibacillus nasuensis]
MMSDDIEFLKDLIRIDSSTANGNETAVAKLIQAKLASAGIDSKLVEYAPGRDSLVADLNPDAPGPILGFTGHEDVVNPGDLDTWTHNPYEPYIDGDKLYGRGAADMKSGLAGLVLTLIRLKKRPASRITCACWRRSVRNTALMGPNSSPSLVMSTTSVPCWSAKAATRR